eukprot:scaffold4617_cov106-Cylindrotheca_fusiformis.AAC.6
MDVLGGYGSDTSSELDQTSTKSTPQTSSMLSLLGAAPSDSSENDDTSAIVNTTKPMGKRRKMEASEVRKEPQSSFLPAPPITSMNGASMIHWDIDYISKSPPNQKHPNEPHTRELADKIEQLNATIGSDKTWADHLKTQHEFHNPRFFQSVVDHFGIQRPLGSQVKFSKSIPLKSYEEDIFNSSTTTNNSD